MRIALYHAARALVVAAALTPAVQAQPPARPYLQGSSSVVPIRGARPLALTTIRVQTSVAVPDGGTATLGGYSGSSDGRSELGAPLLGKGPITGRGFRNGGYGRTRVSGRVSVRVRIINLREEEYRQTGFRSP
jgi:type II secretory pathway component GspD/PulD (secretin)